MIQEKHKMPTIDKQRYLEAMFRTELAKMLCAEVGIDYQPELAQQYLSEFKFYSLEERYLRYLRNERIPSKIYEEFVGEHFQKVFGDEENFVSREYLGWHHIEQLHKRGHIIGSHSHYHYGDKKDFERSLKAIERKIREKPRYVAYPNGVKRVSDEDLRKFGVEVAYLSSEKSTDPYTAPRIDCSQFLCNSLT